MQEGRFAPTEEGTPQGGVISPLLLNIALHGMGTAIGDLDTLTERQRAQVPLLVRYADLCGVPHKSAYVDDRVMPTGVEGGLVDGWAVRVSVGITGVMIRGFSRLDGHQTPDGRGSWMRFVVSPVDR